MLLSVYPNIMQKLRESMTASLAPLFEDAVALLRGKQEPLAKLEYTTAIIKETLRLFPIGFTARKDDKEYAIAL